MEKIIGPDGTYRTAARTPSIPARLSPSSAFYRQVFGIVLRSSRRAKQGRYGTKEWAESSLDILRALESVGVTVEVTGAEHFIGLSDPCVFVGNHMSALETFVLPCIIAPYRELTFVVKQSLIDYPVFKHVMRSRKPVVVGRTNPRDDLKAVLEGGAARLKAGTSLVIFPQTTRTTAFDPSAFNTIGVKLAKKAGVPLVPIALKTDAWGNGRWLKDFGKIDPSRTVHFSFGAPVSAVERGAEEHAGIVAYITEKMRGWRTT
ncbi:MAG: 1-acyl-sn-glycerol-3-phosphate acyltransferase [Nitrospirales bacterium]|nr:1-acyl-sn-glycerol-3-phosphate acyltransferase [Nitrospirales bacterium]